MKGDDEHYLNCDGGGPGGQGDPIIKTGDGFRFKFIGDACRYILFQEDSDDPSYRVVTHHFGGSIFGKEAYFIGSVTVDYGGQRLQLLEGNNIKVNEKDVTSQISTNSTVFGDFALKWNNRRRKFMTADVGPGCFAVIWNGHEGHVNVYPSADLSGKVTGILGNFNGKKEDDLQFQESGKWHTLPLLATKKDMARFSRGWRLDLNSC
ncbi:BMP-binding endothelial regulator protein-like [Saccoglossus kowalevskii]